MVYHSRSGAEVASKNDLDGVRDDSNFEDSWDKYCLFNDRLADSNKTKKNSKRMWIHKTDKYVFQKN